jgi:hypothetical protein
MYVHEPDAYVSRYCLCDMPVRITCTFMMYIILSTTPRSRLIEPNWIAHDHWNTPRENSQMLKANTRPMPRMVVLAVPHRDSAEELVEISTSGCKTCTMVAAGSSLQRREIRNLRDRKEMRLGNMLRLTMPAKAFFFIAVYICLLSLPIQRAILTSAWLVPNCFVRSSLPSASASKCNMDKSKYEIFGRCLRAAGGALCWEKDGMIYLVYEEQNELVEQLMHGPELVDQDIIAPSVKTDAAAAYIYLNEQNVCYPLCPAALELIVSSILHSLQMKTTFSSSTHTMASGLRTVLDQRKDRGFFQRAGSKHVSHLEGCRCTSRILLEISEV